MFCSKCGSKVNDNAAFCSSCGAPLKKREPKPDVTETENIEKTKAAQTEVTVAAPVQEIPKEKTEVTVTAPVQELPKEKAAQTEVSAAQEKTADTVLESKPDEAAAAETSAEAPDKAAAKKKEKKEKQKPSDEKNKKKEASGKSLFRKILTYSAASLIYLVAAAVPISAGLYFFPKHFTPALLMNSADDKLSSKEYGNAEMLYRCIGESEKLHNAEYKHASYLFDKDNYCDSAAILLSLEKSGYKDENDLLAAAAESRCKELIADGKYDYAIIDAPMIRNEGKKNAMPNNAYISRAAAEEAAGRSEEAYDTLRLVDKSWDYDRDKYCSVIYNRGVSLLNSGEYRQALDIFSETIGYSDSEELYKQAAYSAAEEYLAGSDYSTAADYYSLAGISYKDSGEKFSMCCYNLGKSYFSDGDYETAKEYFSMAGSYSDSYAYTLQCDQKMKYSGWYIEDAFLCSDYYVSDGLYIPYYEKSSFSKYDEFGIIIRLNNKNPNNSNYVDIDVKITVPNYSTSTNRLYSMGVGSNYYTSFSYADPYWGSTGSAHFTVSLHDTGDVLGTYYFTIT